MVPLIKSFKLTNENFHQTICQVLPKYSNFHPLVKTVEERENKGKGTLMKFKAEEVIPADVITRILYLTNNIKPTMATTYDNVHFRILISGFKRCNIKEGEHKRNNIFYEYNISTDVLKQECWDEECQQSKKERPDIRHVHPDEYDDIFED